MHHTNFNPAHEQYACTALAAAAGTLERQREHSGRCICRQQIQVEGGLGLLLELHLMLLVDTRARVILLVAHVLRRHYDVSCGVQRSMRRAAWLAMEVKHD